MMLMKLINHNLVSASNIPAATLLALQRSAQQTGQASSVNNATTGNWRTDYDLLGLLEFINRKHNKTKLTCLVTNSSGVVKDKVTYTISTADKNGGREITINGPEGTLVIDSKSAKGIWGIFTQSQPYYSIYSLLTQKQVTMSQLIKFLSWISTDRDPDSSANQDMTLFYFSGFKVQTISNILPNNTSTLKKIYIASGSKWYKINVS